MSFPAQLFRRRTRYLDRRLGMPLAGKLLIAAAALVAGIVLLAAAMAGVVNAIGG